MSENFGFAKGSTPIGSTNTNPRSGNRSGVFYGLWSGGFDGKTGLPWKDGQTIRKRIWIPPLERAGIEYRNPYPKELVCLSINEYRQTFFKPYRVIYRITGGQVIIYLIADGRRDMQAVLARRLLGA